MPEAPLHDAAVVDTRPAIEVDGAVPDRVPDLLVSVEVEEREGGLSRAEIVLDDTADHEGHGLDFAFEHAETNLFDLGAAVRVLTGDADRPREIFAGTISAVALEVADGGQPRLRVMAEDALMAWRMVRRNRSHPAGPVRAIVEGLARDTPLTPVITALTEEVDAQQQLNETDLGFLRRLLARHDADVQVVGTELHVSPRAAVDRGEVTLELGSQLHTVRVTADLADQRAVTRLAGFDVLAGSVEAVASTESDLGPGAGATGSERVEDAFPGTGDRLSDTGFAAAREAQTLVDVAQRRRARRFVIAEGRATGNALLRVGTRVVLTGLGPRFSNTYQAVRARHLFDRAGGYVTDFTAECAYLGRLT